MTITPEAVEAAARALHDQLENRFPGGPFPVFGDAPKSVRSIQLDNATAALTAALPLLLDQLIAEAESPKVLTRDMISRDQAWREFVAWLRSQKDTTNDQ